MARGATGVSALRRQYESPLWLLLATTGLGIGTILAIWTGSAAAALLFGLKPYDPPTLAAAVLLLAGVALAASYGPARQASRLEPMSALREE